MMSAAATTDDEGSIAPRHGVTLSSVGSQYLVSLSGELDRATGPEAVEACTAVGDQATVVDLGGVTFMDSDGYSSLVTIRQMAGDGRRTVTIRGARGQPGRLIDLIAEHSRRDSPHPADEPPDVERQYSDLLAEFAQTMVTDFPIQAILDHLVERIVEVLPIDGAGVTLISPGRNPHYVAASDPSALRFERLQSELGEGPCTVAYTGGAAVSVPSLRGCGLFPAFTHRALADGLEAAFAFPLRHGQRRLGALDLYRSTDGALDERQLDVAQTFANVASAYLINAEARADLVASVEEAKHVALHDPLTGLPNRTLLVERIDHAIHRSRRSGTLVAIMYIDLDTFKAANDEFGHHIGDEVLVMVAHRLTALLRPGDTVARLGGDEFAVLCDDIPDPANIGTIADRISDAFRLPFDVATGPIEMRASVGIGVGDATSASPESILEEADAAMYQAKRNGGGRHARLDPAANQHRGDRADLGRDLGDAIDRDEIRNHYQPIVSAGESQIVGVEALMRWNHGTRGAISPPTTVALAEHTGHIHELGRRVLHRACVDQRRWVGHDGERIWIAVNVSAHQLMSPGFADTVHAVLSETDTEPGSVVLEITESTLLHDSDHALTVLQALKRLGLSLALDDFGTGYSSLSYLMRFPVDIVKIDRQFVSGLGQNPESTLIVGAVTALAHGLGTTVIAEGVETDEQRRHVVELGSDQWQGYRFAPAMPAGEITVDQPLPLERLLEPGVVPRSEFDRAIG